MKHKLLSIFVVSVIILLNSVMSFAVEIPQVLVTATADGLEIEGEISAGLVSITFDNQSEAPILPVPSRLIDDVTQEDFFAALESEGPDAALGLIAMHGGTFIFPESTITITYDLSAGDYALIDFALDEPGFVWFTVEEAEEDVDIEAPEADVDVHLLDFAFQIPSEIEAGEQIWHIMNMGGQWHELGMMRIEDGTSLEEARAMFLAAPEEDVEASDEDVEETGEEGGAMPDFLWIPMEAGEQAWVPVTLEPGTYVIACMLPNLEEIEAGTEPHMHAELGMFQIIIVQ